MGIDLLAGAIYGSRMMSGRPPKVLVFDSGIGGLSVLREVRAAMPASPLVYVADDAGFPYGRWPEAALVGHVTALVERLAREHDPDGIVIACNTASTLVLPVLRAHLAIPVIGTVPAIKPAAERTTSGLVSVLATPGTVARDYTRQLVETHARGAEVNLVGSMRLAALAEARMRGFPVERTAIEAEIEPCFVAKGGRRTDVVVLACTHYPFLVDLFERLAPWPVAWIDPAEAIARRVRQVLLGEEEAREPRRPAFGAASCGPPPGRAVFTSGRAPEPGLVRLLATHGLIS
jgi:glutamate racemase